MDDSAGDEGRDVTVSTRSLLGAVGLRLVEAGRSYFREHPDEAAADPDILALLSAGCRYLREHPEALALPAAGTLGGHRRG